MTRASGVPSRASYPKVTIPSVAPLRGDPILGERYFSREFAAREWQNMWRRVWHVGGRVAELEQPGDYVVHNFKRESVLMVRQENGSIRTFYNSCRHRGNRLTLGTSGAVRDGFRCMYHGWHFGLDGVVRGAQDPEDFPQGNPIGKVRLKELRCETWGGFIWYSMDPDARPLAQYLDPVPELLANRGLDKMVRVVWTTTRVNTNWKFSPDNFNESYRLPTVHPQMQQMIDEDYRNTIFEIYPNGHNRMIEQGQPSMRSLHPNEVEPAWEEMLRQWELDPAEFAGRSRDGRLALQRQKRLLGPLRGYRHFERMLDDELTDYFHHTLFPNVTITGTAEGVHFFRTEPDPFDPEWCTFDYWYFAPPLEGQTEVPTIFGMRPVCEAEHESFTYGVDMSSDHLLGNFLVQDLSVAVAQQQGFHSQGYEGVYLSGQESRIQRFHEVLNDYLEGRR